MNLNIVIFLSRKIIPCMVVILLSLTVMLTGNAKTVEEQQLLSVLTLNLARFTDWPEQVLPQTGATLKLCVFGGNVVQESFEQVDSSNIGGRRLEVVNLSRLRNIEQCQILYISEMKRSKLLPLLLEFQRQPMLTVSDSLDFVKAGGMVGLENNGGKIQLNINLDAVKQSGLVINSRILKLARIVGQAVKN